MALDLSVIISVNNEEGNIRVLYPRLKVILESTRKEYEIIFVEDGSQDNSYTELCGLYQKDGCVNVIKLKKNFGQTVGLLVGMNYARSAIVLTMDGDLQHEPEDIVKLLEKIDLGFDLVNGRKISRTDSLAIKGFLFLTAKKLICLFFGAGDYDINSNFRAYQRKIVNDIKDQGEAFRFLPLMAKRRGIKFCEVDIRCEKRRFGKTHYNFAGRLKRLSKDFWLLLTIKNKKNKRRKLDPDHFVSEVMVH